MKFGLFLAANRHAAFLQGYVEYEFMKAKLKEILAAKGAGAVVLPPTGAGIRSHPDFSSGRDATSLMREWARLLEEELNKVDGFVAAKVQELQGSFSLLSRRCGAVAAAADAAALEAEAHALAAMLVELDKFIHINALALEKIVKKHDKVLGMSTRVWLLARLETAAFTTLKLDGFLVTLSDIYARLRDVRNPAGTGAAASAGGVWVPPESFERATTKYWVRCEDVVRVKALILRHLPVLVFGRDTTRYKAVDPLDKEAMLDVTDSGTITSIYLDSSDLSCYANRIHRLEGARLFRLRWYGPQAIPSDRTDVFVERKTHHEGWIDETSVKERFSIKANKVVGFLDGSYDVVAALDRRAADGELSASTAAKLKALARETQDEVVARRLTAKVRTRYLRAAYQAATNNDVRISLDTELQMFNEMQYEQWRPGQWCCNSAQMGRPGAALNFPYAVLEVKLQAVAPAWVAELLATGMLTPVWKLSKFLTGCAHHLPHLIAGALPHWFTEEGVLEVPSEPRAAARRALTLAKLPIPPELELRAGEEAEAADETVRGTSAAAQSYFRQKRDGSAAAGLVATGGGGGGISAPRPIASAAASSGSGGAATAAAEAGGTKYSASWSPSSSLFMSKPRIVTAAPVSIREMVKSGPGSPSSASLLPPAGSFMSLHPLNQGYGTSAAAAPALAPAPATASLAQARGLSSGGGGGSNSTALRQDMLTISVKGANVGGGGGSGGGGGGGTLNGTAREPLLAGGPDGDYGELPASGGGAAAHRGAASRWRWCPGLLQRRWACSAAGRPPPPGPVSGGAPTVGGLMRDFFLDLFGCLPPKPAARLQPVRVEPKTLFANERTFLRWMSNSTLLIAISVGLLAFQQPGTNVTAYVLAPVACCFLLYAMFRYYFRAFLIQHQAVVGYHDPYGPGILVVALIAALVVNIYFSFTLDTNAGKIHALPPPQGPQGRALAVGPDAASPLSSADWRELIAPRALRPAGLASLPSVPGAVAVASASTFRVGVVGIAGSGGGGEAVSAVPSSLWLLPGLPVVDAEPAPSLTLQGGAWLALTDAAFDAHLVGGGGRAGTTIARGASGNALHALVALQSPSSPSALHLAASASLETVLPLEAVGPVRSLLVLPDSALVADRDSALWASLAPVAGAVSAGCSSDDFSLLASSSAAADGGGGGGATAVLVATDSRLAALRVSLHSDGGLAAAAVASWTWAELLLLGDSAATAAADGVGDMALVRIGGDSDVGPLLGLRVLLPGRGEARTLALPCLLPVSGATLQLPLPHTGCEAQRAAGESLPRACTWRGMAMAVEPASQSWRVILSQPASGGVEGAAQPLRAASV